MFSETERFKVKISNLRAISNSTSSKTADFSALRCSSQATMQNLSVCIITALKNAK